MSKHPRQMAIAAGPLVLGLILAGCGGSVPASPSASTTATSAPAGTPGAEASATAAASAAATPASASGSPAASATTTSSGAFAFPFELSLPAWVKPTPEADGSDFVTWLSPTDERAIRVLHPVAVYQPGATTAGPVPADYQSYFEGLADGGMQLAERATATVGGHPATLYTITTTTSLDGVWGCPEPGLTADVCFGAQPELAVRLALVDMDGQPLLIWVRAPNGADNEASYADFEGMLQTIRFR